mgnify:CR=1 FL=1
MKSKLVLIFALFFLAGCPRNPNTPAPVSSIPSSGENLAIWEKLQSPPGGDHFYRTRTPTGWLVYGDGYEALSLTFVPDPEHKWLTSESVQVEKDPTEEPK